MIRKLSVTDVWILAVAGLILTTGAARADSCCPEDQAGKAGDMKDCPRSGPVTSVKHDSRGHRQYTLNAALQSIESASKALHSGDRKAALKALATAKKFVTWTQAVMGKEFEGRFINANCPIMGSPIKPAKVPDKLIRVYQGELVAFCCGSCPTSWESLSEKDQQAKLAKVRYNADPSHDSKNHGTKKGRHDHH